MIRPIGYDITARETENGNWTIKYIEKFRLERHEVVKDTAKNTIPLLPPGLKVKVYQDRVIIKGQATREQVLGMLALEFLGFSKLGDISLIDLLMALTYPTAGKKGAE